MLWNEKKKLFTYFLIVSLALPLLLYILVNIFAGINRCDWVAEGVVQALREVQVNVPVIVRLAGTNVEEGNKILNKSKLKIIPASDLSDAAEKIVNAIT